MVSDCDGAGVTSTELVVGADYVRLGLPSNEVFESKYATFTHDLQGDDKYSYDNLTVVP